MMADSDFEFSIEGWDEFVENFAKFVDRWENKKARLLTNMGVKLQEHIMPHVPVDTSRLVHSIRVFGEGIPHDYVEVGTDIRYALFVNDGYVQHKRFLPAERLSASGRTKYLKNNNQKGIMLSEKYIQGKFFMEKGLQDAKPHLENLIRTFMEQCQREIEGGRM